MIKISVIQFRSLANKCLVVLSAAETVVQISRAYATVLCPSVVFNLRMYCIVAKRCVLQKNCLKKQIGNGLWELNDHVTMTSCDLKGQGRDPNKLTAKYLENGWI